MKKFLIILLVCICFLCCTACGNKEPDPTGISLAEFNQIYTGMVLSDVKEIVGGDGTKISESENDTDEYIEFKYVYKFDGEKSGSAEIEFTKKSYKDILKIDFSDAEVTKISQQGLS